MEIFLGIIVLFLYFIPAVVGRDKVNADGITLVNFFFGWTFLGWVVALVWAVSSPKKVK
jgi:hypothetical protein